eukprot:366104-Chlamydomonas_euryale.AAC.7
MAAGPDPSDGCWPATLCWLLAYDRLKAAGPQPPIIQCCDSESQRFSGMMANEISRTLVLEATMAAAGRAGVCGSAGPAQSFSLP